MATENLRSDADTARPAGKDAVIDVLPFIVIASLVLGLTAGWMLRQSPGNPWINGFVEVCDVVGTMWVNAIRMTVIPLILPLLIGSVAGARSGQALGRLGLATGAWFMGLLAVCVLAALLMAPPLYSGLKIDASTTALLRSTAATVPLPMGDATLSGWFKALIPANPIKAAADGSMLSLVVFAVMFGLAALASPPVIRERVMIFTHTLSEIMMTVIKGVLLVAPVGVFALTLVVGDRLGGAAVSALSFQLVVASSAHIGVTVILCLLGMGLGRLTPRKFLGGAAPALLVAAGTSSSLSSLPAMIEGAIDHWRLPEEVVGFVLPLAVSTFKLTGGPGQVLGALFVATLFGIHLAPAQMAIIGGYSILMNATVPGIPGGGLIAATPLFLAVGLPLEGLAILFAINPITDRFSTIGNVAADMAVTAIVGRGHARVRAG
jgi:Na+/H+-dicarboxylate symporter